MILFLDTTQHGEVRLALVDNLKVYESKFKCLSNLSENLISEIEKLIKSVDASLNSIEKIVVVNGEGSFVGTRTGISFTNIFAKSRDLSTLSLKKEEIPEDLSKLSSLSFKKQIISPIYGKPALN